MMLMNWVPHCYLAILVSSCPKTIRIKRDYCVVKLRKKSWLSKKNRGLISMVAGRRVDQTCGIPRSLLIPPFPSLMQPHSYSKYLQGFSYSVNVLGVTQQSKKLQLLVLTESAKGTWNVPRRSQKLMGGCFWYMNTEYHQ